MSNIEFWDYQKIQNEKDNIPNDFRINFRKWEFPKIPISKETLYGWRVFGYDSTDPKKLKIGFGSDISTYTAIFAHAGVTIEPFVQIGPHSSILSKSTIDNKIGEVILKRNCRIGAYSTIMPGVTIGENSIIGAYSYVNKSIPANCIAVGIPCKIQKNIK